MVASWELARFGNTKKSYERADTDFAKWTIWRDEAQRALQFPSVILNGEQAQIVGSGFAESVRKSRYTIWACSILPQHIHLVVSRHSYDIEQITNLLKGEATKQLKKQSRHPQSPYLKANAGKLPSMWAERQWIVYLDSEEAIECAIQYVEENPIKEGKRRQRWSFVKPFEGLDKAGWVKSFLIRSSTCAHTNSFSPHPTASPLSLPISFNPEPTAAAVRPHTELPRIRT